MKKRIFFLVATLVCIIMFVTSATATEMPKTCFCTHEEVDVSAGSFEIPVSIQNNPGLLGFGCQVIYDALIMHPVSIRKGKVFSSGMLTDGIGTDGIGTEKNSGSFKVLWSDTKEISDDGELFWVTFQVDVEDEITSMIQVVATVGDTFDENYVDVSIESQSYRIKIHDNKQKTSIVSDDAEIEKPEIIEDYDLTTFQYDFGYDNNKTKKTIASEREEDFQTERSVQSDLKNRCNGNAAIDEVSSEEREEKTDEIMRYSTKSENSNYRFGDDKGEMFNKMEVASHIERTELTDSSENAKEKDNQVEQIEKMGNKEEGINMQAIDSFLVIAFGLGGIIIFLFAICFIIRKHKKGSKGV